MTRTSLLPSVTVAAGLVAAGVFLVYEIRHYWFFGDDWDFLLDRGIRGHSRVGLLVSHGGHWVTIPILIYRLLFTLVGLKHYLPYAAVVIVAHLGVALMSYVLVRRTGGSPWLGAAGSLIIGFLGAGAENTLWDFQIGFVGSVLFGLVAIHLFDRNADAPRRVWLIWVASVASLMCSGMALPFLAALGIYGLLRKGIKTTLLTTSVPAVVYLAWQLKYGTPVHYSGDSLADFIWTGMSNVWGVILGSRTAGSVTIVVAAAGLVLRAPANLRRLAAAGLVGALVEFLLTAIQRGHSGAIGSTSSRYVYVAAVLTIPAIVNVAEYIRGRLVGGNPRLWRAALALAVGAALTAPVVWHGVVLTERFQESRTPAIEISREQILGTEVLIGNRAVVLHTTPNRYSPDATVAMLGEANVRRAFGTIKATPITLLEAAATIEVSVSTSPLVPYAPVPTLVDFEGHLASSGCTAVVALTPQSSVILGATPRGGQFEMSGPSTEYTTYLSQGALMSHPAEWTEPADREVFIGTSAPMASLDVTVGRSGSYVICVGKRAHGPAGAG